jgi:tetratricopeptide (TPR) repeat protein
MLSVHPPRSRRHEVVRQIRMASFAHELGRYEEALNMSATALQALRAPAPGVSWDWRHLVSALNGHGRALEALGRFGPAERSYREALAKCYGVSRFEYASFILQNLGALAIKQGQTAKALSYFMQAVDMADKSGEAETLVNALDGLGTCYGRDLGNGVFARSSYSRALCQPRRAPSRMCPALTQHG